MRKLFLVLVMLLVTFVMVESSYAYKWVNDYFRRDGTYVSGHFRDTSNDGNSYNNANTLGMND